MYKQAEIDSGDIGYGVLGGLLGGGAGWLLGRLIHGDRYKRHKIRQALFALSGMAAGGGLGTAYGKTLANALFGPKNPDDPDKPEPEPEGKDRYGNTITPSSQDRAEKELFRRRAHFGTHYGPVGILGLAGWKKGGQLGEELARLKYRNIDWSKGVGFDMGNGKKIFIKDPGTAEALARGMSFQIDPNGVVTKVLGPTRKLPVSAKKNNVFQLDATGTKALDNAKDEMARIARENLARKAPLYRWTGRIVGGAGGSILGDLLGKLFANKFFPIKHIWIF